MGKDFDAENRGAGKVNPSRGGVRSGNPQLKPRREPEPPSERAPNAEPRGNEGPGAGRPRGD